LRPEALLDFKAEGIAVEVQGALQIGNFQMYVADADTGIDWLAAHIGVVFVGSVFVA
jgi:hypothetical protein